MDTLLSGAGAAIGKYDVKAVHVKCTDGMCVGVAKSKRKTVERAAKCHNTHWWRPFPTCSYCCEVGRVSMSVRLGQAPTLHARMHV